MIGRLITAAGLAAIDGVLTWVIQSAAILTSGLLAGRFLQRRGPAVQSTLYRILYFQGTIPGGADEIDVQVASGAEVIAPWHPIAFGTDQFNSYETLPAGGWYSVQVRAFRGNLAATVTVDRVGIGEVFLTAGQSNSANSGSYLFTALDTVSAWNGTGWVLAHDPQPIA
jgi:hypothetical protein